MSDPGDIFGYAVFLQQLGGDADLCRELASDMVNDAGPRIQAMQEALGRGDLAACAADAHTIKGAAGAMHAHALCRIAATLTDACRAHNAPLAQAAFPRLQAEYTCLLAAFTEHALL